MRIVLGVGLDNLMFGSTIPQSQNLLGLADKSYMTDLGCWRMQFNKFMLELSFEPDNENRLGWIEVHNPQASLWNTLLIGQPRQIVLDIVAKKLGQPPAYEDYGSFDTMLYEQQWLELQFKFDRLRCLNFGVLYDENDNPLWPKP